MTIMNSYVISLILIGCVFIFSTGCVGTEKNPVTTPSASESDLLSAPIWNDPVSQPPKELSATVSADEDAMTHQITVTYNGGGGQQLIKALKVRFLMADGQVENRPLGSNKGDSVTVQGTNKPDRVQVSVWFMDGTSYKIFDKVLNEKNPV